MALQGNDRAITTARIGAARIGAARVGFTPTDTKTETSDPGKGGHYIWANKRGTTSNNISITWVEKGR